MNLKTFKKEYYKARKQSDREFKQQIKTAGGNPEAAAQITLQTFITALSAMTDFIGALPCPQNQKNYIVNAIFDLIAELEILAGLDAAAPE